MGALLLIVVILLYSRKVKRPEKKEEKKEENQPLRKEEEVVVTYSKHIPGYEVKRIFGTIESYSVVPIEDGFAVELAEEATVEKLMDKAKEIGANAVLELQIEKEEHATHIRVIARGLAVKI